MNRREKRSMELPQDANILLSYVNLLDIIIRKQKISLSVNIPIE